MDDLRMASRVGVDHEKEVADSPIRTPPRKTSPSFAGTSIHRLSSDRVGVRWWGSGVVVGFSRGNVFLLKQVRFRYRCSKERTLGTIGERARKSLQGLCQFCQCAALGFPRMRPRAFRMLGLLCCVPLWSTFLHFS
jgi:hypothetical protein